MIEGGSLAFSTSSHILIHQVQQLAWSLGAVCRLGKERIPTYTYKGKKLKGMKSYRLIVRHQDAQRFAWLARKKQKSLSGREPRLTFRAITPVGKKECQCISVSHPDGLYVTENYLVTHNTALALNASTHLSQQQKGVGFFSLEMAKQALMVRILCSEGKVDSHRLRTGFSSRDDWQKLTAAMGRLMDAPLYIDDSFESNMMQIRAKARRLKSEKDIALIVVDYLQLIQSYGKHENRTQEVSSISRSLKGMAKELNVPVLALSQLSRPPEKRNTICPMLSDLRESGSIEQDADVVIFLYPCKDDEDPGVESAAVVNVRVAKQRNGPTGDTKLTFMKRWVKFEDWSVVS
jgi:replicative DNA helicase